MASMMIRVEKKWYRLWRIRAFSLFILGIFVGLKVTIYPDEIVFYR